LAGFSGSAGYAERWGKQTWIIFGVGSQKTFGSWWGICRGFKLENVEAKFSATNWIMVLVNQDELILPEALKNRKK